ncbi:MAG: DUF308 domain-containing protein, partial [Proteobacteria bacterium]|nr:DUF308 domain-containing protein [Pseudomonadota bacterium]
GLSALALLYWVAFWAVLTGVMEISAAIELRKTITQEWSLGILGGLSILVGVLYLAFPRAGLLSLAYILGVYAFFAGILMLSLAYRLWRLEHGKHDIHPPTTMHHV